MIFYLTHPPKASIYPCGTSAAENWGRHSPLLALAVASRLDDKMEKFGVCNEFRGLQESPGDGPAGRASFCDVMSSTPLAGTAGGNSFAKDVKASIRGKRLAGWKGVSIR